MLSQIVLVANVMRLANCASRAPRLPLVNLPFSNLLSFLSSPLQPARLEAPECASC
jgi:hypothetical protein